MRDVSKEAICHQDKIAVTMRLNTVAIEITCADQYEAHVLFDDIVARFKAGETISIEPTTAKGEGNGQQT